MWSGVRQRFSAFNENTLLSENQIADGIVKQLGVRKSLHRAYFDEATDTPNGFLVGSWGKNTAVAPPNDVDIFFVLPNEVFYRIETYQGNKQSSLLQEVRGHLLNTYPQTGVRGDGQVVTIGFNTVMVEVVPTFCRNGQFLMPDTNDGGRWKFVDPYAEIAFIDTVDAATNGNARRMVRMLKMWKRHCNVPLKSYQLELLVAEFMASYKYHSQDFYWYDWFMRDFFVWLTTKAWSILTTPGTYERVLLRDAWLPKSLTARDSALRACADEYSDLTISAGQEWQKIFGTSIPVHV
jgi:hypothetical protein